MSTKSLLAGAGLLALLATPIVAQVTKAPPEKMSPQAQVFVTKAANGGMFEIESSKFAADRAKRAEIKSFAERMVTDHTAANKELQDVASKVGFKVPDKMDQTHQAKLDKLKAASDSGFDAAYMNAQVDAHREAVSLFTTYAKSGDNAELKAFAGKTLPVIQEHEKMAHDLDGKASGASGKSSGTQGRK